MSRVKIMSLSHLLSIRSIRSLLAGGLLAIAAVGGAFSGCHGLTGVECGSDDPACDSTLFLLQFLTSGRRSVPTHLYVGAGSQLQIYSIDRTTGGLTFANSFGAGNSVAKFKVNSTYKTLHVASSTTSGGLYTYSLSTPTSPLNYAGSPQPATSMPFISATPNGSFAYPSTSTSINGVAVNTTAQTLGSIPGLPLGSGCVAASAMHIDGLMYYTSDGVAAQMKEYAINQSTGSLTAGGTVSAPGFSSMVITPGGKYLYGGTNGTVIPNVYGFSLNPSTGALSAAVPGSPYAVATVTDSVRAVATDSRARYLYTANLNTDSVAGFTIDASTGALTAVTGSPFAAGNAPTSVTVSPDDKYVYVTSDNGAGTYQILQFKINSDGSLTQLTQTPTNGNLIGANLDILYFTEPRY